MEVKQPMNNPGGPVPTNRHVAVPVSVVMPVYNEAEIIEEVVEEWVGEVMQYLPAGSEMLFDEAASTDGTREILQRLQVKYPFIRVIYNERKDGFPAAARRLYGQARCPQVFFTDSDGQYVAEEFWKLAPFIGKYAMVHGAKIGRQDPVYRKITSVIFNHVSRLFFDVHYSDINSAFRVVSKELWTAISPKLHCMPGMVNTELFLRAELENYPIKQVHVIHRRRKHGTSRGWPASVFFKECWKAYRGLVQLKREYVK